MHCLAVARADRELMAEGGGAQFAEDEQIEAAVDIVEVVVDIGEQIEVVVDIAEQMEVVVDIEQMEVGLVLPVEQ